MGSASRASWVVAASMGAVEALKDQAGLCRWNYALRSLQQHAKANLKSSLSQVKSGDRVRFMPAAGVPMGKGSGLDERVKRRRRQAEKAEKVYHLVCWGPN